MTTHSVDYLLVGGGLASATAARTLRNEDVGASIAIICGETFPPYQRPPLTKGFLGGTLDVSQITVHPAAFYSERKINVVLGTHAVHVDAKAHAVRTDTQETIIYRKLLIATGASPRIPDLPNAELRGIYYLHSIGDAIAIRSAVRSAKRAIVLGASFVGLEAATSLHALGLHVTVIERDLRVLSSLQAPVLSDYFAACCKERGIELLVNCELRRFVGEDTIEAVVTGRGELINCDFLLVAIGVTPNCEFLLDSGIVLNNGIVVDQFLQTSDADVFAAGDVANFYDPVFGLQRRIEHWDNATRQGRLAAKNMLGRRLPYRDVSMFYGDLFDVPYNFLGRPDDATEMVERGSLAARSYSLLYLKNDVLCAVFSVGRPPEETSTSEELIRQHTNLHASKNRLPDLHFALDSLPSQTVVILQGGGALGAFECGAIEALEEQGVVPDVIAAVSIGALNGAIIASHPGHAAAPLAEFWRELSIAVPEALSPCLHQAIISWHVFCLGVPNFFRPRWWRFPNNLESLPPRWTSLYDPEPITRLIDRYVDFDALVTSPVRLLISAVDVETGELRIFDSYVDRLGPAHLLASGSLPPGLPWTKVDGRPYWDGGIVSNSPLELVIERCGAVGKRVFTIDLFSGTKSLPTNLLEVMLRRDEIVYTDRVRNDLRLEEYANDFSELVKEIMSHLDAQTARQILQKPHFIRLMGNRAPIHITRIELLDEASGSVAREYDFAAVTVSRLRRQGYRAALAALARSRRA
ncbi:bifunctional pyridine nucleotide-disulfide oxidoreductase/patatin-like phospholipase [Caballeronia choica]|jgi:NADPH-dependent 2,4-dienoyl-CoA reductase/sulfur reductase-like enzyme/predicted acylesterase/phospholipase RssA|uniref:Bifunctional pyridine nucleotide-disulfide oxidoreductase/patatin-like phospholipase n=1 Tax=Caballeronia choica TaxID=326476 RepID=A0A158KTZ3_9BURK|nr:FAD-dependent oxidoreductase [Caballeronia choica]SAL83891.1 bifunctional pyridine nucleotide-disulfide oxidoreductase/patatin-like phospholipase [Caballeronia choica]